ncbi:MAG TPA: MFS transporter [Candidatus Saccharimonadales bacterium]|nr:MFS transporter [Candidatus Saccharimonadales bacterium]
MRAISAYRDLLGNGPLLRLLAGEFVSSIGDWLYLVALLIVVYARSGDALLLGMVGAARVVPYVLLSVPAGIAADRFDRRRILLLTDVARGAIMVALAWLVVVDGPLEAIVALSIVATCFSTFFGPTIGAYLPSLVADERQLGPANSAWATLDNLAFVLGPAIAGLLIATGGLTLAFILNAVSFGVVAIVLAGLPSGRTTAAGRAIEPTDRSKAPEPTEPTEPTGLTEQMTGAVSAPGAESVRGAAGPSPYAATPRTDQPATRIRVIFGLGLLDGVGSFAFGGVSVLTVVLATGLYASGEAGTGYLNAAIGVGGLLGAVVSGALVLRPSIGRALVAGGLVMAAGLAGLGFVRDIVPAMVALVAMATGELALEVVSTTIFQRSVPDAIRGRALGAMATASSLAYAAGSLVVPVAADRLGVTEVMAGIGIVLAVATIAGRVLVGTSVSRPPLPYEAALARVAGLPIFAGVSPARLEMAIARLVPRRVTAGETIVREGDPADRFYVIVDGRFRVAQRDPQPVAARGATRRVGAADEAEPAAGAVANAAVDRQLRDMGPDEVFGEIGLLHGSRRTATVTALTDGQLLTLDGPQFLDLVASSSGLGTRLTELHRGGLGSEARSTEELVSAG